MKKKNIGFTLIELVMVIILIGILAAVALPRFVDLGGAADDAAADGVIGGLKSGVMIYYASTAVGGSPAYPTNPFDPLAQKPKLEPTNVSACSGLETGEWGVDSSTATTAIYYKKKSDSICWEWDYVSSTGVIGGTDDKAIFP